MDVGARAKYKSLGGTRRNLFALWVLIISMGCATSPSTLAQNIGEPIDENGYRLSPADVIEVFVWKEPDLSRTVTIRPDGGISYPLVGEIEVAGRTVSDLQQQIQSKIQAYVPAAVVTVSVSKVAGYRVYVMGEVRNPGEYVLNRYVTIAQALTLADGLTTFASESDIRVLRQSESGEQVFEFNYSKFKRGKNLGSNIRLVAGDVVVVR